MARWTKILLFVIFLAGHIFAAETVVKIAAWFDTTERPAMFFFFTQCHAIKLPEWPFFAFFSEKRVVVIYTAIYSGRFEHPDLGYILMLTKQPRRTK